MVHSATRRLIELRATARGTPQISFISVQFGSGSPAGAKRPRGRDVDRSGTHFGDGTFGGRGNFLPANQPVVFKRSFTLELDRDRLGALEQPAERDTLAQVYDSIAAFLLVLCTDNIRVYSLKFIYQL